MSCIAPTYLHQDLGLAATAWASNLDDMSWSEEDCLIQEGNASTDWIHDYASEQIVSCLVSLQKGRVLRHSCFILTARKAHCSARPANCTISHAEREEEEEEGDLHLQPASKAVTDGPGENLVK